MKAACAAMSVQEAALTSLAKAGDGILDVRWRLARSCNYNCHFCSAAFKTEENCVFVSERIQAMCARILAWPCAGFNLALAGGEASLHPWLAEIVRRFYASRRPVFVTLASNGSQTADFYLNLAARAPAGMFRLALAILPQYADMPRLLMLISMLAERGQHVWARLAYDGGDWGAGQRCLAALTRLRETVAFDLDIMDFHAGCGFCGNAARGRMVAQAREAFAAAIAKSGLKTPVAPFANQENGGEVAAWLEAGAKALRIEPDGSWRLSSAPDAPRQAPLWEGDSIGQKSFDGFARAYGERAGIAIGAPRKAEMPASGACGSAVFAADADPLGAYLRRRFDFLKACAPDAPCQARPGLLADRAGDIRKLHGLLADEQSREVFLRNLKALAHGDGKWLAASAYAARRHPKAQAQADDIRYAGDFAWCTALELMAPSLEDFAGALGVISEHRPKLFLQARLEEESLLDMPLRLLQACPDYDLYMGQHGGEAWFYGRPLQAAPIRHAPLQAGPAVSLIVLCRNNAPTIRRALDSLLLQDIRDLQVIVVDDASNDDTGALAAAYCGLYPQIFSLVRMAGQRGAGACRNAGLERALGRHAAFLRGAEMLEPGVLAEALAAAEASGAEIVDFGDPDASTAPAAWQWSGAETFTAFLQGRFNLGCEGKLYSRRLLARHNIHFGQGDFWGALSFNIRAFYYAGKALALAGAGCPCSGAQETPDAAYFHSFALFADFLADFCANHGLDAEGRLTAQALRIFYAAQRRRLFQAIEQNGAGLAKLADLRKIGRLRQLLQLILADCASLHCRKTGKKLRPAPERHMPVLFPEAQCRPYGDADAPGPRPRLSVIMPNYNKLPYLPASLDSILSQSFRDYELIIIDDASTDGSFELLVSYACRHPQIRLYSMSVNARQGICRNFGIDAARGEYVIFADSDDLCMPGYFERALEAMAGNQAEMTFFSTQELDAAGDIAWTDEFEDANLSKTRILDAFFQGQFQSAPWGKVFRLDAVRKREARFAEYVYHQDGPFLYAMLGGAGHVQTCGFVAVQRVHSQASAMRPRYATALALHSAYAYYIFIERAAAEFLRRGIVHKTWLDYTRQIEWNMENVLLPQAQALAGLSELIEPKLYPALAQSPLFVWSLLKMRAALEQAAGPDIARRTAASANHFAQTERQPLATVVIVAEQAGAYAGQRIEAALKQSLSNIELIIIAGSERIAEELALLLGENEARARLLIMQAEAGACRNQALDLATAPYVAFADGYLPQDFLLHGVARLEQDREADFIEIEGGLKPALRRVTGAWLLRRYAEGGRDKLHGKLFRKSAIAAIPFAPRACGDALFLLNFYAMPAIGLFETAPGFETGELAAAPPFGCGQLREFFAACADVSAFFRTEPGHLAQKRIANGYAAIRQQLFNYCAALPHGAASPFGSALLRDLRRAPELFRILLEDLAVLYAQEHDLRPQASVGEMPLQPAVRAALYPAGAQRQPGNIALSLILPCGDDADALRLTLAGCLDSLADDTELLLLDACSQNPAVFELARASAEQNPQIRFFRASAPLAYGPCANLAVPHATGSHLLFLQSGCELDQNFLANAASFCRADIDLTLFAASAASWPQPREAPASREAALLAMLEAEPIFAARCLLRKAFAQSLDIHFGGHVYCATAFVLRALLGCAAFASQPFAAVTPPAAASLAGKAAPAELFQAQLARLRELADLAPGIADKRAARALAAWLLRPENAFLADICSYVNLEAELCAPSPLTPDTLEALAFSDDFLQLLLMRLARMGQAACEAAHV